MKGGNWQVQIGRRFYLPLRSWRENHEGPAGNFGELNSSDTPSWALGSLDVDQYTPPTEYGPAEFGPR